VKNILDVNTSPNEDVSLQEIETIDDFAKQKGGFDKAPEEKRYQKSIPEDAVDNESEMVIPLKNESKKPKNVASTIDRTFPHQSTTFTSQTVSVSTDRGGQGTSTQEPASGSAEARKSKKRKKIMLDDFLWALLQDETYISCIQWTMKERLEFKFSRPEMVAKLWGDFKKKKRMNYEKLSRGLRYYYHSKKLERIQHKHYHFRFLKAKNCEDIQINFTDEKSTNN